MKHSTLHQCPKHARDIVDLVKDPLNKGSLTRSTTRKRMDTRALGLIFVVLFAASCKAESPIPFDLSELPDPPKHLRELIDRTPIIWESGERQEDEASAGSLEMAGETKFAVHYSYRCGKKWRTDPGESQLHISVRFAEIEWKPSHRIWMKDRPPDHEFWTNRIVLHELDHLRISSDPRHGDRFKQRLKNQSQIVHNLTVGDIVDQRYVDQVVRDYVEKIFHDHTDLIEIRYKELDRVTVHGKFKVPQDSPIAKLLEQRSEPVSEPTAPLPLGL